MPLARAADREKRQHDAADARLELPMVLPYDFRMSSEAPVWAQQAMAVRRQSQRAHVLSRALPNDPRRSALVRGRRHLPGIPS